MAIPGINSEIKFFNSGVQNLLDDTLIPSDAASDEKNWFTQDGRIKLIGGRIPVNTEGLTGSITGEIFGYKADGSTVHWRKAGTKIQYDNGSTWVDVITGLTASADYAFSNYSSLAGTFTFAFGADGIFKMNNANPGSYIALYNSAKNFKGRAFINKGRSILWNRTEDKTGVYGSYIDTQNSTVYTSVSGESGGTGDGSTKTFTPTLAFKAAGATRNAFGISVRGVTGAVKNITGLTAANPGVVTAVAHGYTTGDIVIIYAVVGMTQVNGKSYTITVVDADHFSIGVDTSAYTAYSSGGKAANQSSQEVFTDAYLGALSSPAGGTGTINYITGAMSVTFNGTPVNTSPIVVSYQWEDSNIHGVTDFTHSTPRLPGEGFQFPQDSGGDAILNILIGQDNAYYSMKSSSVYRLFIADDDTASGTTNEIFYKDMGIMSWRGAISTQIGILFMNTANPEKPELTLLQKNPLGGEVLPKVLMSQFKFANYTWSDACFESYERFIPIACRSLTSSYNDVILLVDIAGKKVDIVFYPARTFATNAGNLYCGSPITLSVYNIFNGFDDKGLTIDNFWTGKGELYQPGGPGQARTKRFVPALLKKHRRIRLKGLIDPNQRYAVYVDYDDAGPQIVGTVLGSGSYVDRTAPQSIGGNQVGGAQVGGNDSTVVAYPYFVEIRIKKPPKFMKRKVTFIALGIGYVDISYQNDWGLQFFEDKIPARFRQKQNVSKDGATVNQNNPEF